MNSAPPAWIAIVALAAVTVGGCINWRAGYEHAARRECQADPDESARRACLDRVEADARDRRNDSPRDR